MALFISFDEILLEKTNRRDAFIESTAGEGPHGGMWNVIALRGFILQVCLMRFLPQKMLIYATVTQTYGCFEELDFEDFTRSAVTRTSVFFFGYYV